MANKIRNDISNKRFNKLVAIKPVGVKNGKVIWECKCDCGNIHYTSSDKLKSNMVKSCGCLRKEKNNLESLVGKTFNNLQVLELYGSKNSRRIWRCKCLLCGNEKNVNTQDLKLGKVKSCGCLKFSETYSQYKPYRKSKLFAVWTEILLRCNNQKNKSYKNYGGRGIKVCKEWEDNFLNFYNWAIENGYKDEPLNNNINKWSIDRIDNNGNYEPSNCRWVTNKEQINNRRVTKIVTYNGEKITLVDFCKKYDLCYSKTLHRIFTSNWSIDRVLNTP